MKIHKNTFHLLKSTGLALLLISFISGCSLFPDQNKVSENDSSNQKLSTTSENSAADTSSSTENQEENKPLSAELTTALKNMQAGEYDKSLTITKGILAKSPQDYQAWSIQGMTLALQGNTQDGLMAVKKSYAINPNYVANYYNLALVYKLQGNLDESKKWFDKVLAKDPKNVWSIYGIATIYADKSQDAEALKYLQQAINLDSSVKGVAKEQDHFQRFHGNKDFEAIVN